LNKKGGGTEKVGRKFVHLGERGGGPRRTSLKNSVTANKKKARCQNCPLPRKSACAKTWQFSLMERR